jgi:hypothetical protein
MAMFGGGPPPMMGLASPPSYGGYGVPPPAGSDDAPRLGYFVSFPNQFVMLLMTYSLQIDDLQFADFGLHSSRVSAISVSIASVVHCPVCSSSK